MPGGRPRAFKTPEEFQEKADAYFESCKTTDEPVTWTGLCLFVGMSSRQSLERYKRGEHGQEFVDPVKTALAKVEHAYEKRLVNGGGAGAIFALKNFKWRDKQEIDHRSPDGSMSPTTIEIVPLAGEDEQG